MILAPHISGSIPAWAGETSNPSVDCTRRRVYPRVGGGNSRMLSHSPPSLGLSPRGRGKLIAMRAERIIVGSIPAWAGETIRPYLHAHAGGVYPRVGGGNCIHVGADRSDNGLSPRGRGKLSIDTMRRTSFRSIPAWAGETPSPGSVCVSSRVYPRVGGGNLRRRFYELALHGLSPRGRGKRTPPALPAARSRSIPAWAGETANSRRRHPRRRVYPRVGGGNAPLLSP